MNSGCFTCPSDEDIIRELRFFIRESSSLLANSSDLPRCALFLIKHLPASRSATLDYLKGFFKLSTAKYIEHLQPERKASKGSPSDDYDETVIAEIYNVLHSFIDTKPTSWAPIISTWCLELLGEISTEFSKQMPASQGLNETLQLWMRCKATKTLVDLTTQCLSSLMYQNSEGCISALLDISIKHSPHFDWVVAHVGSCFPKMVIERVLSCGLKDFCQNKSYLQGLDSPKLKSVVGILGHLVTSHTLDIQKAVIALFENAISSHSHYIDSQKLMFNKATVPFLLQVFNLSDMILNSVSDKIKQYLNLSIVINLYHTNEDWSKYFGSLETFKELLVNLIIRCSKGGSQIINLLLDFTTSEESNKKLEHIRNYAQELLESVLNYLESAVMNVNQNEVVSINLLNSLIYDIEELQELLLQEKAKAQVAARIVIYIGQLNPSVLIQTASFVLQNATEKEQLAYLVRILRNKSLKGHSHFDDVLQQIFHKHFIHVRRFNDDSDNDQSAILWNNILTLLKWENSTNVLLCCPLLKNKFVSDGLANNMTELMDIFKGDLLNGTRHIFAEILEKLVPAHFVQMSLQQLINLVDGIVDYFFVCCQEEDHIVRIKGLHIVKNIFNCICPYSKIARSMAVKQLIERSLFSKEAILFGSTKSANDEHADQYKSLLTQNKKISKTIHITKHSSVYNGGIIGDGRRKSVCASSAPTDFVTANKSSLIETIKACCIAEDHFNKNFNTESLTLVSLHLVQIVSPDIMYNGLPWPSEDFSKVTIERDLQIRRLFNSTPLLWDLLNFVALYRPALCYCSVLLRALTATLIHQWSSTGSQNRTVNKTAFDTLLKTTIQVIDLMALGQVLPPPLSNTRDILQYLSAEDIVLILRDCIWAYMRDNIPSPALFVTDGNGLQWRETSVFRPADSYTKTLRIIMQRNIKQLGPLYAQMFRSFDS